MHLAENGEIDEIDQIGFGTRIVKLGRHRNMVSLKANGHRRKNSLSWTMIRKFEIRNNRSRFFTVEERINAFVRSSDIGERVLTLSKEGRKR
jgi:hypothetical protein